MDRFRLDDPDAAEKALHVFTLALGGHTTPWHKQQALRAVLDAIEQPRLPTRSEVEAHLRSWLPDISEFQAREIANAARWATEDPEPAPTGRVLENANGGNEPEVDPAHVVLTEDERRVVVNGLGLARSIILCGEAMSPRAQQEIDAALAVLASGRVQVTPEPRSKVET